MTETYKVQLRIDENGKWSYPETMKENVNAIFSRHNMVNYVDMEFKSPKKNRTLNQNDYYWAVVVPMVVSGFILQGNDLRIGRKKDLELVHELLKDKFGTDDMCEFVDMHGEVHTTKRKTTTNLDTKEFNNYVKDIINWSKEYLDINIPGPNGKVKIFNSNGEVTELELEDYFMWIDKVKSHV
jgi:hypothetical protein